MASSLFCLARKVSSESSVFFRSWQRSLMATVTVDKYPQTSLGNTNRNISTSSTIHDILPLPEENSYEGAIGRLNSLQSNLQSRKLWSKFQPQGTTEEWHSETQKFLERGGLTIRQLDTLNVIHVAGTKGKGTTCAFVESILRHAGLRTGFYSSPHLVAVRERIRINGKPLAEEKFAKYFYHVYLNMEKHKETNDDMPAYFRFLTCMAFYTFYQEGVDVVVLEVGIGGTRDPTNIIRQPVVTGITSLGLEHQPILGETLEEIALAKAGIMKSNAPCFTLPTHPPQILKILQEHAATVKCPLLLCPPLGSYAEVPQLGVDDGAVSELNASIALQLAHTFIQHKFPERLDEVSRSVPLGSPLQLLSWHRDGLAKCVWPGRFQVLDRNARLTYFLDGAHTADSLKASLDWFTQRSLKDTSRIRILVFCLTGERIERNAEELLRPFATSGHFHSAVFCPILVVNPSGADNWSALGEEEEVMKRAFDLGALWKNLSPASMNSDILPSINHVVENLDGISREWSVNVLVTGSLQLVGSFLSLLDPGLNSGNNRT